MLKNNSTKMKQAIIVAALITGSTWGLQMATDAANLMVTIPSNYSSSIMGSITGSRVTTTVDGIPHSVRTQINRTSVIPGLNSRSAVPGRLAVPRSSMQISPAALAATMKCSGN